MISAFSNGPTSSQSRQVIEYRVFITGILSFGLPIIVVLEIIEEPDPRYVNICLVCKRGGI